MNIYVKFLKQTRAISPMILHFCVNIITSARVHMCSHHHRHHHHQYRYKENRYRVNWWIVSMWDCRRWQSNVLSLLRISRLVSWCAVDYRGVHNCLYRDFFFFSLWKKSNQQCFHFDKTVYFISKHIEIDVNCDCAAFS